MAWPDRLTAEFTEADRQAAALASPLTEAQLNWKPAPNSWSVGQCLEHLCVSNEIYLDAIASALPAGVTAGASVPEITPGWFARWFIRNYIDPATQTTPKRAPGKITPGSQIDAGILSRFVRSNARAREIVARAKDLDVNRLRFRNPFVPVIRFTIGTGLDILAKHNRRHLLQAERVTKRADFPCHVTS